MQSKRQIEDRYRCIVIAHGPCDPSRAT